MNLNKEHWWNNVNASVRDKVELSLFITRYICSLLIFVLGLKAPGIQQNLDDDYIHLNPDNSVCYYLLFFFFFFHFVQCISLFCGREYLFSCHFVLFRSRHEFEFNGKIQIYSTGIAFYVVEWMEENPYARTISLAKEKHQPTVTRVAFDSITHCRARLECSCTRLQPKNR